MKIEIVKPAPPELYWTDLEVGTVFKFVYGGSIAVVTGQDGYKRFMILKHPTNAFPLGTLDDCSKLHPVDVIGKMEFTP